MQQESHHLQTDSLELSQQQAQAILHLIGRKGVVHITQVTQNNHVWRLHVGSGHRPGEESESFYLKIYTKEWYGGNVPMTEFNVRHERDAYALLARQGLPTVEVALARPDCDNPLYRPFLLTRALQGRSLNELLAQAEGESFANLLERTGEHMRRMHSITFAYPGYLTGDGPLSPPAEGAWQHPAWSAQACQKEALARLERERSLLSAQVAEQMVELYTSLDTRFATAYEPLRFVQTNMHSHQFYLEPLGVNGRINGRTEWRVTGVLDMEVASAGDSYFDLVAFALEMAAFHAPSTRWWEPFFTGYGAVPDFELFRDHMLVFGEESFKCFGPAYWCGTRQEILAQLLAAQTWEELFAS